MALEITAERSVASGIVVGRDFAALIQRARALDEGAWDQLYRAAFPQVYRYVASKVATTQEAEDITEDVFLGALQTIAGLRAMDEAGFVGWLFQIARFKIADQLRRRYRKPTEPLDPELEVGDPAPGPEDEALAVAERAAVRDALGELTDEQREVILMKFVLDYDNARAGAILGKSPGAINQLQHRALGALRRVLERPQRR